MKTPEEEYQQSYVNLTTPEDGRDPVLVYAIPAEIERLKGEDLDAKGFLEFIMQDEDRKETFLSDMYFTANLMKELEKEGASEVLAGVKEKILEKEPPSKYKYVFDSLFFVKKTTKEELQKELPIVYPNLPDEAVDVLVQAQKNKSFVTLISGDAETGKSWGEINDIKGVVGLSRGKEWRYPLLVSFKREDEDGGYEDLHTQSNSKIKQYLDENYLELDDVLSSGGMTISESIVAIKKGFSDGGGVAYKHQNFTPKYDIENAKVEKLEFEEKTTKRNTRTNEETTETRNFKEFRLSATDSETGEMEIIFQCKSIEDMQTELAFQYELALKNPAKADAEKKLEASEKALANENSEPDAPKRKSKNRVKP